MHGKLPRRVVAARTTLITLAAVLGGTAAACTAASPPRPPPPAIQTPGSNPNATLAALAGTPAVPRAQGPAVSAAPTVPPIILQAAAAAPPPPGFTDEVPTARDLANGMIGALANAKTARLLARLSNGNRTDMTYIAPDRAALIEQDPNNREVARFVIIGDTGYSNAASAGWNRVQHQDFRKQTQVFRPMQVALAMGKPRTLESGAEVDLIEWQGRPALRAIFDYSSAPELEDLGLSRTQMGNSIEIIVDPDTWRPYRTREETQGAITEVDFVEWDAPRTIEPPT